jgi:hypothetical protein
MARTSRWSRKFITTILERKNREIMERERE